MTVIRVEREVAAPAAAIWSIVSAITAVERNDGGSGFGVGTVWRETRVMFGREATESMAVTEVDD